MMDAASPRLRLVPYRSIPVLVYHQVSVQVSGKGRYRLAVHPDLFESHMKYLHDRGYATLTLDRLAAIEAGKPGSIRKQVAITFDDGYVDNYRNAFPILQKYGQVANVFLASGFVGKTLDADGHAPRQFMSWPQAREMRDYGISFQGHTCTHPDLTRLSAREVSRELLDSRRQIEDALGEAVRHFAYPFGRYNRMVTERVREAGYGWSYAAGESGEDESVRERFDVDEEVSGPLFPLLVSGWGSWVRGVRNRCFRKARRRGAAACT